MRHSGRPNLPSLPRYYYPDILSTAKEGYDNLVWCGGGRTPYYRMDPATGSGTLIYDNSQFGYDWSVFHHSGNWVNQDTPDDRQWFLISTYGATTGAFLKRAIGFMRLDGSDIRFLAHTYNESGEYWSIPRAQLAPNGKLIMFGSEFRGTGGGDVYIVEVPLR